MNEFLNQYKKCLLLILIVILFLNFENNFLSIYYNSYKINVPIYSFKIIYSTNRRKVFEKNYLLQ